MARLLAVPTSPILDATGHVYVTLPAKRRCLRLNRAASVLWRQATTTGVDRSRLNGDQLSFLVDLEAQGSLRLAEV